MSYNNYWGRDNCYPPPPDDPLLQELEPGAEDDTEIAHEKEEINGDLNSVLSK